MRRAAFERGAGGRRRGGRRRRRSAVAQRVDGGPDTELDSVVPPPPPVEPPTAGQGLRSVFGGGGGGQARSVAQAVPGRGRMGGTSPTPGRTRAADSPLPAFALAGLVIAGRASLWPEGGGPAVEIARGDWVTFRRGFLCTWVVHEEIAKRYAYFDAAGAEL